jgi:hypothetical protein
MGASLLAKDVNDNAGCLNERGVRTFIASRLAPTGTTPGCCFALALALALAFAFAFAFDLDLPRRKAERRFCAVGTAARMPR